jgi:hypothetical protein
MGKYQFIGNLSIAGFYFYRLVSSPTENEPASRNTRFAQYTLRVIPNEERNPKKQVRYTVEIPPTVGMTGSPSE